ncbi:dihydrofolate reductase family protein [Pelagibius marinus]|uniref:dihydrofolate reductase family protein n=1 Tax=Pelagibius marinus TaxID=2762760 RepID=UPI002221192F|nr:dihydrofolate reductase family protein [Pelagibius marinus]
MTFTTLDGVMQAPALPEEDCSGGFSHGGWAMPWWDEVMAQVRHEAMVEPYDLLLGRKTYELFASHFSELEGDDEASMMNAATKYVATNTPKDLDWKNSIPITGDVPAQLAQLKTQTGPLLQVHGSWALIQSLFTHDLVDEIRLWTFPVMVGPGKRLFGSTAATKQELALTKSATTANGVVMSIYRCKRRSTSAGPGR